MKFTGRLRAAAAALFLTGAAFPADASENRVMHYFPDGRDFVCLNGCERYTRALYGTPTAFRLETSDRPVFAVFEKCGSERNFNFSFFLNDLPLDSTTRCESRYRGGMRRYVLHDNSWGDGTLTVTVMALSTEDGALWRFEADGFVKPPAIRTHKRLIACTGMKSYGDIRLGDDQRWCYEASTEDPGTSLEWSVDGVSYLAYHHESGRMEVLRRDGDARYALEEEACRRLDTKIEFDTPDPFINALGPALVEAAEGIWDGESHTWLHGASAWRMEYNGWRGALAGDALGWSDRSEAHIREYLKSMVTDVPQTEGHPANDPDKRLARSRMDWGTPMYSDGYICVHPGGSRDRSLYDMNLNFFDGLLTHVSYYADTAFLREIWPYLVLHLDWEKRNFDPDGDHLYDAYCCIWASDALYYNSGAVTHSSAYNYRGNLVAARIAEILCEDPAPYREEAEAILEAMDSRLWLKDKGHWAEYQDFMGFKRLHESAALWSVYTPIDCGACTAEQAWQATRYVETHIPHVPVKYTYDRTVMKALGIKLPKESSDLSTISESDWLPYVYSTNNIVHAEVLNTALAFFQAGRNEEGFKLLKADILDGMYMGRCPGNIGLGSYYDAALKEWFRDFGDGVGIAPRAVIGGLYGVIPDALHGRCIIRPGFPSGWDKASLKTPYLSYSWHRERGRDIYEIRQNFPQALKMILRVNTGGGHFIDIEGTRDTVQTIIVNRKDLQAYATAREPRIRKEDTGSRKYLLRMGLSDIKPSTKKSMVDLSAIFNADVTDIYRNEYLNPRSPYTTLQIPVQGIGEWCHFSETFDTDDTGLRRSLQEGVLDTGLGLTFLSPGTGHNIAYTSLWNNYPDSVSVPLSGRAKAVYLLLAGSTNNMQSRIENGAVTVRYTDGQESTLPLANPVNWCPLEQDYNTAVPYFTTAGKNPYRVFFSDGTVSRDTEGHAFLQKDIPGMPEDGSCGARKLIPCGAGLILRMPLDTGHRLERLTLRTLSNDVVIGLMGVTLEL